MAAPSAKFSNCVRAVVRLSDDEIAEILQRADEHQKRNADWTPEQSTASAVEELIAELRASSSPPSAAPQVASPFGGLTGETLGKQVTDRIAAQTQGGFTSKVDNALAAGEITQAQSDHLRSMGQRNLSKAKDELVRLREKAAEDKNARRDAGAAWEDPDFNHEEGHPKFADLSEKQQQEWTSAHRQNKANGELYEKILDEHQQEATAKDINSDVDLPTFDPEANARPLDKGLTRFGGAIRWLKTSPDAFVRGMAERLEPYLVADNRVRVVEKADYGTLPPKVRDWFENKNAAGLSSVATDGTSSIYLAADANEVHLLHELVHAATQRGLVVNNDPALTTELNILTRTIGRSLDAMLQREDMTPRQQSDAQFFRDAVDNPHELLAYAFSSPTFRDFLTKFKYNGDAMTAEQEGAADRVREQAAADLPAPEAPTLWQRFVDFARGLIGLDKKYDNAYRKLLANNEADRTHYITTRTPLNAMERLDGLLQRALEQQQGTTQEQVNAAVKNAAQAAPAVRMPKTLPKSMELPAFDESNRFMSTLKDWTAGWRGKPGVLGWMTLRQLAERFSEVQGMKAFQEASAAMGARTKSLMGEAHKIDQTWATLKKEHATEMQKLMLESTMEQMWLDRPLESQAHLDSADAATRAKYASLTKRWNALPEDARRTYNHVQAKMRKDWDERGKLLNERIIDQYRAELHAKFKGEALDTIARTTKPNREAALKNLSRAEKRSVQSLWSDLDEHGDHLGRMHGPYFPLMRFGEHVVVAKSTTLTEAMDAFDAARDKLDGLMDDQDTTDDQLKAARDNVKRAQEEMEGFKSQEKHYLVEFYESRSDAAARQRQLVDHFAGQVENGGPAMAVYTERRQEHFGRIDQVPPTFLKKLEGTLSESLGDKDANAVRAAVRDLYIQSLPERSALKSELKRIGVMGVKDSEMRRAFAASAMRNSWHLSRLEFGPEMNNRIAEMRTGDTEEERILGAELTKRMAGTMQQDTSNILLDRLSNLSYLTYLGLSPSFFIVNAMQPWMISLPVMSARHGIKASTAALWQGFTDVGAAMRMSLQDQKTWRFELNLENFKDAGERQMLENLFNKGIIDVTIEHDLGSIAGGDEKTMFGKVMDMASLPAHHTEVINRVMTALAAYRLESKNNLGERASVEQAINYAEKVVADTHLDYTPENSPRLMRSAALGGLGRIIFQFKKYMQGMIYLLGKNIVDAVRGDKEAMKASAYLMGMTFAGSGAVGLPVAAPLGMVMAAIAKMYPDDDEPQWFQLVYQGIKDLLGETAARALIKGLPAALGVDISGRVGLGNLLNPIGQANNNKEGADWVAYTVLGLAGPAPSMMANWVDGLKVAKDDPMKGVARVLPKFLADPLRAVDRYNRGITDKRGNELVSPDEFGAMSIGMRAIGFEMTDISDLYDRRGAFLEARHDREEARTRLVREAANERKNGDASDSTQEKIDDFNERHPDHKITGASITQAVKSNRVTAQSLKEGVSIRKNDRALAESLRIGQ